ncbi:MAG: membrane protein insertase YidC [Planctomycetaceae bacterium]|nr:membrane protein insertase YidC [Planctomycetaceae bacterium]
MEKRLVIFLVISVLILTGHMLLMQRFFPPRPAGELPPAQPADQVAAGPDEQLPAPRSAEQQPGAEAADPAEVAPQSDAAPAPAVAKAADPAAEAAPAPEVPQQWLTLGSYAPESGRRLLVTLTNRGAAIERVELVERRSNGRLRYRDLTGSHGYLGAQCHDTTDGCTVSAAAPGTPAAAAGMQAGDVIVSVDGLTVATRADLQSWLLTTKPRQIAQLNVRRGAADQVQQLSLSAALGDRPLELVHLESPTPSYLLGINRLGEVTLKRGADESAALPSLQRGHWEVVTATGDEVTFRYRVSGQAGDTGVEFRKRYRLTAAASPGDNATPPAHAGYDLQMSIEMANLGTTAEVVSYNLDGPTGLPTEGWWYSTKIHPAWGSAGARDVIWRIQGNRHSLRSATQIYKQAQEDTADPLTSVLTHNPTPAERTFDYLGVDTQYFSAVLMAGTLEAPRPFIGQQAYAMPVGGLPKLESRRIRTLNTTFRFVSPDETLEPGQTVTHDYHIFLGPKSPEVLDAYGLDDIIEYGWFGWISKPLSKLLHAFHAVVRNYGLAIILLTVLVRGLMFPIGRKAARNAQIMQELAPEIKKIKEKYKNDLEKQGQAQRELWKKHNFNPLGGCWLMFLQLPIFIGLYRCLSVDIELRQSALIPGFQWCSNLAGPDMAWHWQGILPDFLASETGWLGPYLNILPIVTIMLFIWQQKMFTPPATDEQTRMQQKMMQYMMVFMGVLFFKVPAGLCVYFVASSLWGIGERKLLPPPGSAATTSSGPASPRNDPTKPSLMDRLMNKPQAESVEAMRARRRSRR